MQNLAPSTRQRLLAHLSELLHVPANVLSQPGTTIRVDPERDPARAQVLWMLPAHTLVRTHPRYEPFFASVCANRDADYQLTAADCVAQDATLTLRVRDLFYTIDSGTLITQPLGDEFHIRPLAQADSEAFEAFKATCSESDKAMGQVNLDDEMVFGVLQGDRIASVASSFEWHNGFVDVGVLTDPHFRGKGLGKAVIVAITEYYLEKADESRSMLYRHEVTNLGSGKIAEAVGYQQFAALDYLQFANPPA